MCSHCGLIGHTIEKCYRKIGFPPGYQRKPRTMVNAVQATDVVQATEQGAGSNGSSPVDNSGGVTISQEQYRSLYSLFQGHGSATQVIGPNPPVFASCVTKTADGPSRNAATDGSQSSVPSVAPYVPSPVDDTQGCLADASVNTGSGQFTDDWYS
ncbi:hypothetical protein LINPERPRIM_LOCUS18096 [Linum perenne]